MRQAHTLCRMSKARHPLPVDRHVRDLFGSRVVRQDPPERDVTSNSVVCVCECGWLVQATRALARLEPSALHVNSDPITTRIMQTPRPLCEFRGRQPMNRMSAVTVALHSAALVTEFSFFLPQQKAPIFLICTPEIGQGKFG